MIKRRVNVRGIIYKNGKVMAQQLTPDHEGNERNYWCTPGGGMDNFESLHEGLIREMIEETGITPKIGKLLFIQQFSDERYHDGEVEQLEFFFHIENADDYEVINLENTSHGLLEIKNVDFIDPKKHNLLPDFLQTIDIEKYIVNDMPVFISNKLESKK